MVSLCLEPQRAGAHRVPDSPDHGEAISLSKGSPCCPPDLDSSERNRALPGAHILQLPPQAFAVTTCPYPAPSITANPAQPHCRRLGDLFPQTPKGCILSSHTPLTGPASSVGPERPMMSTIILKWSTSPNPQP